MGHWEKKLCMLIEDELEDIAERGHVDGAQLDATYKLVEMWSKLKTQKAMDEYIDWDEDASYYGNMRSGRMYDGGSYRRGRDSMGRYTSRDASEKDSLKMQLHELSRRIESM